MWLAVPFDDFAEMHRRSQFLDLSYTRTFPSYDGLQMLDTMYPLPEGGRERLKNLETLGFRQVISHEQLKKEAVVISRASVVIIRGRNLYDWKRTTENTFLLNYKGRRAGKPLEVMLWRRFDST